MDQAFDITLLLVSGTACLYCILLNRRLKSLQDVKRGIGASITELSAAVQQSTEASMDVKQTAEDSANRLQQLLRDVSESETHLREQVDTLDAISRSAIADIRKVQHKTVRENEEMRHQHQLATAEMTTSIEEARQSAKLLMEVIQIATTQMNKPTSPAATPNSQLATAGDLSRKRTQHRDMENILTLKSS